MMSFACGSTRRSVQGAVGSGQEGTLRLSSGSEMGNDEWKILRVGCPALDILSRRISRCPRPLEVMATKLAGDVHHFTNEIQAGHVLYLHRF